MNLIYLKNKTQLCTFTGLMLVLLLPFKPLAQSSQAVITSGETLNQQLFTDAIIQQSTWLIQCQNKKIIANSSGTSIVGFVFDQSVSYRIRVNTNLDLRHKFKGTVNKGFNIMIDLADTLHQQSIAIKEIII